MNIWKCFMVFSAMSLLAGAAQAATCQITVTTDGGKPITYYNSATDETVVVAGAGQVFPVDPNDDLELRGPGLHTVGCQDYLDENTSVTLGLNCDGVEASTRLSADAFEAGAILDLPYKVWVHPVQAAGELAPFDPSVGVNLEIVCVQ